MGFSALFFFFFFLAPGGFSGHDLVSFSFFWGGGFLIPSSFAFERRLAALGGLSLPLLMAFAFLFSSFRPFWISEALVF